MNVPSIHWKFSFFIPAIAVPLALLLVCAPTRFVGNGSGTSSITGTICGADGTPAAGVNVTILTSDNTPSPSLKKESSYDSILTDVDGRFSIVVKPDIFYNVIAEKGGLKCFVDSIITTDTSEVTNIGKIVLEPAGSLEGRVSLSAGHDPRTVLILVFGTNTFTVPNGSDGAFVLKDMPAGRYAVRFMSTIAGYRALDTVLIVSKGVSDTLGSPVRLAYTGLQKVTDATALWDSLLLTGAIRWRPVDTAQVHIKGYNVYRGSVHMPLTLRASMTADTFYAEDSLYILQDSVFWFRINAVLTTGEEGFPGLCTLDASKRAWKKTTSMRWLGFPPYSDYTVRFMEAGFGRLFMVNEQTMGVMKVQDQPIAPLLTQRSPGITQIRGIAVSNTGFYVANAACPSLSDSGSVEIYAYSRTGDSLGRKFSVKLSGQECGLLTGIKSLDGKDFYFLSDLRMDRRDSTGAVLSSLRLDRRDTSGAILSSASPPRTINPINTVFGTINENILHFFSTEYLTKWQFDVLSSDFGVKNKVALPDGRIDNFVANRGNNTVFSLEKKEILDPYELRYFLTERSLSGAIISRLIVKAEKNLGAMFCCDEQGGLFVRDAEPGLIVRYER
jgi:hypothetical protein